MPISPTQPAPATEPTKAAATPPAEAGAAEAVFGFVLFGGPLSGALVRDVRLANELAGRGWPVHAWWVMDRPLESPLVPEIGEHWLFHGFRYVRPRGSNVAEAIGRFMSRTYRDKKRMRTAQKRPGLLERVMRGLVQRVCMSVEGDRRAVRRFAGELSEAGVTHLLPMLAILCPWAAAARALVPQRLRYLVTFQGYELYVHYARAIGCEQQLYERLRKTAADSDWPAIAVSEDYRLRVAEDIGVPAEALRAIPPGIPGDFPCDRAGAADLIASRWPEFRRELPLVTFLGRRDTEKGIDLLLYAVTILRQRGLDFQLAVVGPTLFGDHYSQVCQQLAEDLRCPVMWSNKVVDELRSALFAHSRCIVYPSIHREPFGMVAVEALAHRTPAVVPDHGGIAAAIEANDEVGGLRFRSWDSGHLAEQIERMLTDDDLHRQLAEAGPRIAEYYSVRNLADRVLAHLGLPATPSAAPTA
ncbi:MAG: glycosyltransferase family 4 protein [Planctomycetota bacterium]|jgi:glycosyltransferase involved in cell wall biosynthesis